MAKHILLRLNDSGTQIEEPEEVRLDWVIHKKVDWKIADKRIKSFRIESKYPNERYPFTSDPNTNQGTEQELKAKFVRHRCIWEYNIIWKSKDKDIEHTLDPKIAVEPLPGIYALIAFSVVLVGSLFFIKPFRKCIRKVFRK